MLIFVGVIAFLVAAGFVGAAAIVNTAKPRLKFEQILPILYKYHDESGEFHYESCAYELEAMLEP